MPTKVEPLTPEQVMGLPAMPTVRVAFAALNISEGTGYKLIREDEFPIEVVEFGRALRVRKTDLVAFLHLPTVTAAEVQSAAAANSDGARRQEDRQRAADFQASVKAGHVEDVDTWHARTDQAAK